MTRTRDLMDFHGFGICCSAVICTGCAAASVPPLHQRVSEAFGRPVLAGSDRTTYLNEALYKVLRQLSFRIFLRSEVLQYVCELLPEV